ncbi:MAG: cation diffusion facilitator family transporter [Patescibacteria group bacterium]|nr:cation diffusion facilitator family transporter [Patescibacteria group bacterium]
MKEKISIIAILANTFLASGKIAIGLFSHSSSILADGFHSFVDIFASAIGYLGIKISKKPADEKHPYGHFKYEVLAGTIITLILFATGAGIIYEAYSKFFNPIKIEVGYLAFSVMLVSAIANEIMARLKIYYGKKENSIALMSDGSHSRVDVFASLAVFAGLFLTKYWPSADPIMALLIGVYIIKESFSLGKEAVDSLLDVSADPEIEERMKAIIKEHGVELESLKTQKKGFAITANLEIKLAKHLNLEEATKISEKIRKDLIDKIENLSYIVIQIKSYDIETDFYKPAIGKGFSWQNKGKFKRTDSYDDGKGPGGKCVCPKCGYEVEHKAGVPCSSLKCPKCGIGLERK